MASLGDSLRLKAAGAKGPSVSGPRPLIQPDVPLEEGKSGGIAASKARKNAGSTSPVVGGRSLASEFARSLGANPQSDKTTGYF